MTTRTATARYQGFGKEGKGHITTQSGVLTDQFYGFNTRFADEPGTNPDAAHAGCFTMALSFALARAGFSEGSLETRAAVKLEQDGDGFTITRSDLTLTASVPGLAQAQFEALAAGAHANCPVSKLLKAESSLDATLL
ncbi:MULTISPECIES: OsmC family protein [unclassified Sphingomonas]|jgi:lipoyl-dependent peroxiredoxin|uniref:OsmC family protein n=1 Tax=unclassified Sphingomonas TaxID=196159 RepID=UPI000B156C1E|nr:MULTISPECIES: OsmC family protein [unclassified Sphingomonas]